MRFHTPSPRWRRHSLPPSVSRPVNGFQDVVSSLILRPCDLTGSSPANDTPTRWGVNHLSHP